MPILFHKHFSLATCVYASFVIGLIGLLGAYALFQGRHIISGPLITLIDEPAEVQHSPTVEVTGEADNIVSLSLNGRTIYTNDEGHFHETLVLGTGYSTMTLTAKDRYGRTHSLERTYVRVADEDRVADHTIIHQL